MSPPEKFLFNVSFDEADIARAEAELKAEEEAAAEAERVVEELPSFSEEEMEAARRDGFDAGKAEGIREAGDAVETQISDSLNHMRGQFQSLFEAQTKANAALFDDSINIAVAIARKCFPHLNETHAPRLIEDMMRQVLAEIIEEPRALVYVHQDLVEPLNERVSNVAETANFEGQILILEDEKMPLGDCRITWSSGSAERDMASIWQQVDEIVEQNLDAVRQDILEPETESADGNSVPDAASAENAAPAAAPEPIPADTAPPLPEPALDTEQTAAVDPASSGQEPEEISDISDLEGDQEEPSAPPPSPENELSEADEGDSGVIEDDQTAVHLQAGPGIVEEAPDEAILELDTEPDETTEDPADEMSEEAAESMPPMGPNA